MPASEHTLARRTVVACVALLGAGCTGRDGENATDGQAGDGAGSGATGDGQADGAGDQSGTDDGNPATGEVEPMGTLELSSPAFDDGERIPEEYGYRERNVNPPLTIEGVPPDAESLALVVDDPDAVEPAGKVWDHWIVWNVPPDRREIPEDWTPERAEEGTNDYGEVGYGGPNPPDREHRYRFKLFALETTLDLPTDTGAEALGDAMEGSVLARTQLDGTYPAE